MHKDTQSSGVHVRVCECVLAEQRDPFCQSGQCWKRFKATFYSRHFASPAPRLHRPHFVQYVLLVREMLCSAYMCVNVLVYARCLRLLYFWTCMSVCDREQSRGEQKTVSLQKRLRSKRVCCNYVAFFTLLWRKRRGVTWVTATLGTVLHKLGI